MTNIAILRDHVFLSENTIHVIEFDNLVKLLIENRNEKDSDIKKFNIKRQFKTKNGIIEEDGLVLIPFNSLVRFISDNYDNFEVCRTIFADIISKLLTFKSDESSKSTYTLYKEISASKFLKSFEPFLSEISVNEDELLTLKTDNKNEFSKTGWKKICIFEYHWQKHYDSFQDYEDVLHSKFMYWENLRKTKNICKYLTSVCLQNISSNLERKKAHEDLSRENFENDGVFHSYLNLDVSVRTFIEELTPTDSKIAISTVDCMSILCH